MALAEVVQVLDDELEDHELEELDQLEVLVLHFVVEVGDQVEVDDGFQVVVL